MDINDYRREIDEIDSQMLDLFVRRMDVAAGIAAWKKEAGKPVYDPERERKKLLNVASSVPEEMKGYAVSLYSLLMELSRARQHRLLREEDGLAELISRAIENTPKIFPESAVVACQGVEGAYSQIACQRLFRLPDIFYFDSFDGVFSAIEKGLCQYGVIPVENSTAGSVNSVYDLMIRHHFHIVRSVRVKVDHSCLAKKGTRLEDVREIFSHPQAISQSGEFLRSLKNVKITPAANTAMAAKMVAESDRSDVAALSSRTCADLYGLETLRTAVQDQGNNFTRFICITRDTEIYPGADRTSLMMVLPHEPGSLYKILSRFYALGINLNKLESRPMPERNFEFMFYFDLDTSVYSPQFIQLMGELPDICEEFNYLGSYSEVI